MNVEFNRVNIDFALRSGRAGGIEFWRTNHDGTVTRVRDGLTLSTTRYTTLPPKPRHIQPLQ